jgi:hypothetical protein
VTPSTLAYGLEQGSGDIPGQLAGVPFSVVSYEALNLLWANCGGDCVFDTPEGDTQCGNLVATPIDSLVVSELAGVPVPPAFSEVSAEQSPNGKWNVAAQAFVSPTFEEDDGSASYVFELGTREVIDVSGGSGLLPLEIGLRAASHLGVQFCAGDLFRWIPSHSLRFRVREATTFFPFTRDLVSTVYYDQFFVRDEVFAVEVNTPSVLTVDVWFRAIGGATGANDIFGNQCRGGLAVLDFAEAPAGDGIQLFFSPDPSLTLVPRSGIAYAPVPEPGGAFAGLVAFAALVRLDRRNRP